LFPEEWRTYAALKPKLEYLGFDYKPQKDRRGFDVFLRSLKAYKQLYHGSLDRIRSSFVVPEGGANYPEGSWGYGLRPRSGCC